MQDSSSTPKLIPLTAPPPMLSAHEHDAATSSTPASFADIPPRLVLALEEADIIAEPAIRHQDVVIESRQSGRLWLTEE